MKLKFIILLSLLTAGTVRGQFFFLSQSQSVSASATASVHQISSNFNYSADSGNLGGTIFLSDPDPDKYGNSGERAYAQSLANLGTGLGAGQISIGSSVQVGGYGPSDGTGGLGSANAISTFQVSFMVSSPQVFEMSCTDFQFLSSFPNTHLNFSMVLSSANLGIIGGWGNQAGQRLPYFVNPLVGELGPGDVYTLREYMEGNVYTGDPISEITMAQASLTLTAVPEPSSGLLVGMGVVVWLLMRPRVRQTSGLKM